MAFYSFNFCGHHSYIPPLTPAEPSIIWMQSMEVPYLSIIESQNNSPAWRIYRGRPWRHRSDTVHTSWLGIWSEHRYVPTSHKRSHSALPANNRTLIGKNCYSIQYFQSRGGVWRLGDSILCLTSRTSVTSARIPEEDDCYRARNLCVFSKSNAGIDA